MTRPHIEVEGGESLYQPGEVAVTTAPSIDVSSSTIEQHKSAVDLEQPDSIEAAAEGWSNFHAVLASVGQTHSVAAETLEGVWIAPGTAPTAELMTSSGDSFSEWALIASQNGEAMHTLATSLRAGQSAMSEVWGRYESAMASAQALSDGQIEEAINAELANGHGVGPTVDAPEGADLKGMLLGLIRQRYSDESRTRVIEPMRKAYHTAMLSVRMGTTYRGPKAAGPPATPAGSGARTGLSASPTFTGIGPTWTGGGSPGSVPAGGGSGAGGLDPLVPPHQTPPGAPVGIGDPDNSTSGPTGEAPHGALGLLPPRPSPAPTDRPPAAGQGTGRPPAEGASHGGSGHPDQFPGWAFGVGPQNLGLAGRGPGGTGDVGAPGGRLVGGPGGHLGSGPGGSSPRGLAEDPGSIPWSAPGDRSGYPGTVLGVGSDGGPAGPGGGGDSGEGPYSPGYPMMPPMAPVRPFHTENRGRIITNDHRERFPSLDGDVRYAEAARLAVVGGVDPRRRELGIYRIAAAGSYELNAGATTGLDAFGTKRREAQKPYGVPETLVPNQVVDGEENRRRRTPTYEGEVVAQPAPQNAPALGAEQQPHKRMPGR
ncbi:hypothetical protein [Blastococcus sp. Marseille-P5729]|uniref:hypothetical protein n=1 Tax=Blastococcus sp. Marseille-P5729 TaxID=2086582 RepID=UPI000D0E4993|nr:hypothetical protein [Blastococcus sp. Marseille-P5729]